MIKNISNFETVMLSNGGRVIYERVTDTVKNVIGGSCPSCNATVFLDDARRWIESEDCSIYECPICGKKLTMQGDNK